MFVQKKYKKTPHHESVFIIWRLQIPRALVLLKSLQCSLRCYSNNFFQKVLKKPFGNIIENITWQSDIIQVAWMEQHCLLWPFPAMYRFPTVKYPFIQSYAMKAGKIIFSDFKPRKKTKKHKKMYIFATRRMNAVSFLFL